VSCPVFSPPLLKMITQLWSTPSQHCVCLPCILFRHSMRSCFALLFPPPSIFTGRSTIVLPHYALPRTSSNLGLCGRRCNLLSFRSSVRTLELPIYSTSCPPAQRFFSVIFSAGSTLLPTLCNPPPSSSLLRPLSCEGPLESPFSSI